MLIDLYVILDPNSKEELISNSELTFFYIEHKQTPVIYNSFFTSLKDIKEKYLYSQTYGFNFAEMNSQKEIRVQRLQVKMNSIIHLMNRALESEYSFYIKVDTAQPSFWMKLGT